MWRTLMEIKTLKNKIKAIDYRHYVSVAVTLVFIALGVFVFPNCIPRIIEALRDFGTSVAYYFCELFMDVNPITPMVNELQSWQWQSSRFQPLTILPFTWEEFQVAWDEYWQLFVSLDTLQGYFFVLGEVLYYVAQVFLILMPLWLVAYLLLRRYLKTHNNDYDEETKGVRFWKRVADFTYIPVKKWIIGYIDFLRENFFWVKMWLWLWAFYFNFITIIIEFIAFYLYFITSFDFVNIYRQVYKLMLDLTTVIRFIPAFLWVCGVIGILEYWARCAGYNELNHRERRNRGFLNERGVMTIVYGPMGAGKTKLITDMALSEEVRQRDMALEIIIECDFKFPYMHWASLEQDLKQAFEQHVIFSEPTARKWVKAQARKWYENPVKENVWGYDFERYGLTYNDCLKVSDIWEVIEDYACAYLIYTVKSALLVSNYSIRLDNLLEDLGNFPLWNSDFFRRDSRLMDSYSRHAHILDFDMLRLGKRMLEENPNRFAFGFGVYIISEIDKERKNTPDLKDVKSDSDECNQKNDLFNALVKMSRHRCVVANRVFVRFFADLQRPESLGADARELGEIIYIEDKGEMNPILPFFAPFYIFEALFSWLFGKFVNLYLQYRFVRSDKTVPMYALKSFSACLKKYMDRTCNIFGSSTVKLSVESGRMDGERKECKYFLQSKKIYAKRYSTDCLSGIFDIYAENNTIGINDLAEYTTERGTDEENLKQNSHFQKEVHSYNDTKKAVKRK